MLDANEPLARFDRRYSGRAGAHERVTYAVARDITHDLIHHLVGLNRGVAKVLERAGSAGEDALEIGQLTRRMVAPAPGVEIEFEFGDVVLVGDGHGGCLLPDAQRHAVEQAVEHGGDAGNLIVVAEHHRRAAQQRVDNRVIEAAIEAFALDLIEVGPVLAEAATARGSNYIGRVHDISIHPAERRADRVGVAKVERGWADDDGGHVVSQSGHRCTQP